MNTLKDKKFGAKSGPLWIATAAFVLATSLYTGASLAIDDPNQITFTLEGCRNDGNPVIALPNGDDQFICQNSAYTTGNLGTGNSLWAELDLVPHRVTLKNGNGNQTYRFIVAGDYRNKAADPAIGWDFISKLTLNTALSDAGCQAVTSGPVTITPSGSGVGGVDQTIYRTVDATQVEGQTCVYDYYQRLALGASKFSGSSLQSNLWNQNLEQSGIGQKRLSIPVNKLLPQKLEKNMSSTQDSNHQWNVVKSTDNANVSFGDVCSADFKDELPVDITVTWTKLPAEAGMVTAIANITATNPTARTIRVNLKDVIYQGTTQTTALDTYEDIQDISANSSYTWTHQVTLEASVGNIGDYLNDVATATYTDLVTGIDIPGNTQFAASAQIQAGTTTNTTANVSDEESITGDDLKFSVASPSVGSFTNYTDGTQTIGPVNWEALNQADTGSVIFNKTIHLLDKTVTSGTLTDTASLVGSNGFATSSPPLNVGITSTASVCLTINKSIPPILQTGDEPLTFDFQVTGPGDYDKTETITFAAGDPTDKSVKICNLSPGSYSVKEIETGPLAPDESTKSVDISLPSCTGSVSFANAIPTDKYPIAKAQKVTVPTGSEAGWTFNLYKEAGDVDELIDTVITTNDQAVQFSTLLTDEGDYYISEVEQGPLWDKTNEAGCSFTVNFPGSIGATYTCIITNTKRGSAEVIKTFGPDKAPLSGDQAFTFQLRKDATMFQVGTILETQTATATNTVSFANLVPGNTYQLCELVPAGWSNDMGNYGTLFTPGSIIPPNLPSNIDNLAVCVNFSVAAGETKAFNINNMPPPGGRALTIGYWKNWSSCSSGRQLAALDDTLAMFTNGGFQVGDLFVDICTEAVALLDKRTLDGKKAASDAGFNFAAQYVAYRLNMQKGSYNCAAANTAASAGQAILDDYNFNGYLPPKAPSNKASLLNGYAFTLDQYNNNLICQ